jgi:hypothetical protein
MTDDIKQSNDIYSIKVNDVVKQFENLPETSNFEKFTDLPYFTVDHIQGYTQYQNDKMHYIFTHSLGGRDSGRIVITHGLKTQHQEIRTPSGWNHPGGIQCVGSFLFVPCEKDKQSIVCMYDLTSLQTEPLKTFKFNHEAGSLGIVDFTHNGKTCYLLLLGDIGKKSKLYHAYISEVPTDGDMTKIEFTENGSFELDEVGKEEHIGCQGFGLITDTSNNVFMIALASHGSGLTCADWGYLIKLSIDGQGIQADKEHAISRHFISKGCVGGVAGCHFRWGAGIRVTPDRRIVLLATSRNIIAGNFLNTTYWA